jgi:hypothetical protein
MIFFFNRYYFSSGFNCCSNTPNAEDSIRAVPKTIKSFRNRSLGAQI